MKKSLIVLFCSFVGFEANAREVLSALVLKKPIVFNLLVDEKGEEINPARRATFHFELGMRHEACTISAIQLTTLTNQDRLRDNQEPSATFTLPAGTRFTVNSYNDRADEGYLLSGNVNETKIHASLFLGHHPDGTKQEALLSIYCSNYRDPGSTKPIPSLNMVLNRLYVDLFSYETKKCFLICL